MQLAYENGLYFAKSEYAEMLGDTPAREVVKGAGFRWNPDQKQWQTTDSYTARKFMKYADAPCKAHLEALVAEQERTKEMSRAQSLDVELPCPQGLAYLAFQRAGIMFCSERPSVLLADTMGLGKTVQVLGVLNNLPDIRTVLVVCPATIKLNWRNEAAKWLLPTLNYEVAVVQPKWTPTELVQFFSHGSNRRKLAIVNYDILHRFGNTVAFATAGRKKVETFTFLDGLPLDMLVADEAHFMKSETARRSRAVRGVTAKRRLLLSGTPIVNRPKELFPLLNYLDPFTWNNFFSYGLRFCAGHQNGYGWNFSGASALPELHDRLRSTIMIRRNKEEVLQELPKKVRQVIELPMDGARAIVAVEQKAYAKRQETLRELQIAVELAKAEGDDDIYTQAVRNLKAGVTAAFTEMAKLRHDTAMAKVPAMLEHIKSILEAGEKVIVFCHHHDVIDALKEGLKNVVQCAS